MGETTKLQKNEEEDVTINTKIVTMEETFKRLEVEDEKMEQEAKNTEITITSESSKKVNKEVKTRKQVKQTNYKKSLKSKIEKLTKIVEQKEKRKKKKKKKIIEETKKI